MSGGPAQIRSCLPKDAKDPTQQGTMANRWQGALAKLPKDPTQKEPAVTAEHSRDNDANAETNAETFGEAKSEEQKKVNFAENLHSGDSDKKQAFLKEKGWINPRADTVVLRGFTQEFGEWDTDAIAGPNKQLSSLRKFCKSIMISEQFEMFIGFVIMFNFACIAFETDIRAKQAHSSEVEPESPELRLLADLNLVCLSLFLVEVVLRMYVQGY